MIYELRSYLFCSQNLPSHFGNKLLFSLIYIKKFHFYWKTRRIFKNASAIIPRSGHFCIFISIHNFETSFCLDTFEGHRIVRKGLSCNGNTFSYEIRLNASYNCKIKIVSINIINLTKDVSCSEYHKNTSKMLYLFKNQ